MSAVVKFRRHKERTRQKRSYLNRTWIGGHAGAITRDPVVVGAIRDGRFREKIMSISSGDYEELVAVVVIHTRDYGKPLFIFVVFGKSKRT